MSDEPNGYVDKTDDDDELVGYDVFIVPQADGKYEAHIKATDGREWACGGYETEAQASAGAMHFFQLYLMDGES